MSVITFISDGKEQTGKTLSAAAIATYMGIEHNMKILLIATSKDNLTLSNCFFPKQRNTIDPRMQLGGRTVNGIEFLKILYLKYYFQEMN